MAKRDPGLKEAASIILTASVAGTSGTLGPFVYSATKAAVISMTKWAAVDLGSRNIRVNCIQYVSSDHPCRHRIPDILA
jgi:NAD(P)-dependent dehydrogenase (short-subunit alcohol dehydrogenase family)